MANIVCVSSCNKEADRALWVVLRFGVETRNVARMSAIGCICGSVQKLSQKFMVPILPWESSFMSMNQSCSMQHIDLLL